MYRMDSSRPIVIQMALVKLRGLQKEKKKDINIRKELGGGEEVDGVGGRKEGGNKNN